MKLLRCFLYGLLLPLSFAPFHIPGFAIVSLALFYHLLQERTETPYTVFFSGLAYGLGFFGFGTSWIYVSIHDYGHLNFFVSALITLLFLLYLSLYPAVMALVYSLFRFQRFSFLSIITFPALWTLSEFLRSTFFTGFPWLLVGFGQFDSPSQSLLPIIGVYGVSFLTALAATLLCLFLNQEKLKRVITLALLLALILSPQFIHHPVKNTDQTETVSAAVIQENLSMRDKWDEALFWSLLERYQRDIHRLLGTQLIVLPESAIPVSETYISDILKQLNQEANAAGSSIVLGVPKPTEYDDNRYYNAMIALGQGEGVYLKKHLVPFGEYIPTPFQTINHLLSLPDPNMDAGDPNQTLITINHKPVASLICYELAYGNLLRAQLPEAQFIISISDDGWFGHSLAMVQHQQIAQVRSLQTQRYQILANNDGLSSIIDSSGHIQQSLAPFSSGLLTSKIMPLHTTTPWVKWGDQPIILMMIAILFMSLTIQVNALTIAVKPNRRYPYKPI